ncbi:Protein CBR-DOP-6 [Caenorhabditis briggsae]|uniref:Protein CBR-DOP-6 n=1 Tax=Caenorhabditis briggsae TaxID=6238 RepID=A8XJW6_CAEBR|nr:Protein CBR-DOP-6 [Caenorhabditis briggsae]CAP32942.2 Protein CBR-DOP-6 [Caenorhabditis briggsae]
MNESEIEAAVAAMELEDQLLQPEWSYLVLSIVPLVCILGNLMVVAAVWTTKSLQTPTNHLLVSLAMADLIVGAFVMPFSIYLSINGLHWHLPLFVCYFYCVLDVAASTSSIIHLVLISIDRLVAATKPAEYKTMKHRKRVYLAIAITWIFSIALSLPLGTGFNTRTSHFLVIEHHCGIYNPVYMKWPVVNFLDLVLMLGNITTSAIQCVIGIAPKNRNMITWEKPLLKKIEETAAEHASSLNDSEREQLQTILEAVHPSSSGSQENTTIEEDPDRPPSVLLEAVTLKCEIDTSGPILELPRPTYTKNMSRRFSDAVNSISSRGRMKSVSFGTAASRRRRHSHQPVGNREVVTSEESKKLHSLKPPLVEKRKMRRLSEMISDWERPSRSSISNMYLYARRESVYIARKKLAGLKDWALDLLAKLKSKQGMAIRRETRATKLVATVMVVFLVCWLPFFTLNMIKIYKLIFNVWSADLEIWFHWFTALGYLNSSLNFFIYSTINPKFRHSFRRLLGFRRSSRRQREKSWMLPPRDSSRGPAKCGCGFHKIVKSPLRKTSSAGPMNNRKISMQKPEIVIDEISPNRISISAGGNTTFRRSSDDCIRRSSSEIIGGITLPSQSSNDKRRGSGMSNSSASLHIHETRMTFEAMVQDQADCEIFV